MNSSGHILALGGLSQWVAELAMAGTVAEVGEVSTRFNAAMNVSGVNGLASAS